MKKLSPRKWQRLLNLLFQSFYITEPKIQTLLRQLDLGRLKRRDRSELAALCWAEDPLPKER